MNKSVYTAGYSALRIELRRSREEAGLSQRALAAILDVAPSWISNVETGERRIDLVEFALFMRACGVDPVTAFSRIIPSTKTKGRRSR